jgi:hypothetical protein
MWFVANQITCHKEQFYPSNKTTTVYYRADIFIRKHLPDNKTKNTNPRRIGVLGDTRKQLIL